MKMREVRIAIGSSLLPACLAIANPVFIHMGVLPGGVNSSARAISTDGSAVVGTSEISGATRVFRWTSSDGMVDLGTLSNSTYSNGESISADGSVVVGFVDSPDGGRPFRWTVDTGMQEIELPTGLLAARALGVSGDGQTVVGFARQPIGQFAFRWTAADGVQLLHTSPWNYASATNSDGSIIVGWRSSEPPDHPFQWTANSPLQDLVFPGTNTDPARALALSADGTVAAGYGHGACIWVNGVWIPLGLLPGGHYSQSLGISGDGRVVVGTADRSPAHPPIGGRAFVWTAPTGMHDLNVLLPNLGVNLDGWALTHAHGASADGTSLVGEGEWRDENGSWHRRAWLITGLPIADLGACCRGSQCVIASALTCHGSFQGVAALCEGELGNPTTCCLANYNGEGGVSIQDLFDFLGGFFSGEPAADINDSGNHTPQDIFDFLAMYFTGCPE